MKSLIRLFAFNRECGYCEPNVLITLVQLTKPKLPVHPLNNVDNCNLLRRFLTL